MPDLSLVPLDDVQAPPPAFQILESEADAAGDGASHPVPVEVVARERVAAMGREVHDRDSGDWVRVSPAMVSQERQMRDAFALGKLMQAVVMRQIVDEKLYLAADCETLAEYAEEHLGVSKSTAYDLYRVGTRYAAFLPTSDVRQLTQGIPDSGIDSLQESVQGTSFSNLLELTRIGDDHLDSLLEGSALQLADGRTVSLDTLRRASGREAKETITALKREYRGRIQRTQEDADTASAERDIYKERLEKAEATTEALRDGARLWGPRQLHAEGQIALFESIETHLKAVGIAADQIDPDDDVPDAVARSAAGMLHRFETHLQNLRDRLAPLTTRL